MVQIVVRIQTTRLLYIDRLPMLETLGAGISTATNYFLSEHLFYLQTFPQMIMVQIVARCTDTITTMSGETLYVGNTSNLFARDH